MRHSGGRDELGPRGCRAAADLAAAGAAISDQSPSLPWQGRLGGKAVVRRAGSERRGCADSGHSRASHRTERLVPMPTFGRAQI